MKELLGLYSGYFGQDPLLFAKAPGRINLIGEHTDYNKGFVLPAAIDRYMHFAIGLNEGRNICHLVSHDLNESISIPLDYFEKSEKHWANYFIGILQQLRLAGNEVSEFNLIFGGDIPIGGGLSSSSALECGFLKLLNNLFDFGLNNDELVSISQRSNHEFLDLQGGIMDQHSILNGTANHAMLLNCDSNSSVQIPLNIEGHDLVIIDSKVSHELVSSAYNVRVQEGKEALKIIQKRYSHIRHLSMVTNPMLSNIEYSLSRTIFKRVKFIVEENERVHKFCRALQKNDLEEAGQLLYDSHQGLKDQYEVSCAEMDLLVELAKKSEICKGFPNDRRRFRWMYS